MKHAKARPRRVRFAARHPYRTLKRNQIKVIRRTGFGFGQIVVIGGYSLVVTVWVVCRLVGGT